MAVAVVSYSDGRLVHGWPRQGISLPETPLDNARPSYELQSRIKALAMSWTTLRLRTSQKPHLQTSIKTRVSTVTGRDLYRPYQCSLPLPAAPPSYDEALHDIPPDYTATDALASVWNTDLPLGKDSTDRKQTQSSDGRWFDCEVKVDLTEIEGLRSYANKKAKKAAKTAQQAKWTDDGDGEEKNEGEEGAGEDGAGGGGDAGGAGDGAGGDPPGGGDGGGGDDGDDAW